MNFSDTFLWVYKAKPPETSPGVFFSTFVLRGASPPLYQGTYPTPEAVRVSRPHSHSIKNFKVSEETPMLRYGIVSTI